MKTSQISVWTENFGREYTDRNSLSLRDLDVLYEQNYGVGRRKLNQRFLAPISCDSRILEVGCNLANQLALLEAMGYSQLHGVEIQHYALQQAQARLPGVRWVEASAFELPYPDGYFDMIFTSGVLIHIAPGDLPQAMAEIHRCASSYIWGFEYYAAEATQVRYRGHADLLWKMDYAELYLRQFADLELVRAEHLAYKADSNVDCMFMLRKNSSVRGRQRVNR
jgi:pseudaminic acid biosynthesis-associated methylase